MIEMFLLNLDVGLSGALLRAALGAAFVRAVRTLLPSASMATATGCFLILLFGIKTFAAVARRVVPATALVRSHWEWRRSLARFHDSYQWRKLVWFGAGIIGASGAHGTWEVPLGVACLAGGVAGEILWRRTGRAIAPPVRG